MSRRDKESNSAIRATAEMFLVFCSTSIFAGLFFGAVGFIYGYFAGDGTLGNAAAGFKVFLFSFGIPAGCLVVVYGCVDRARSEKKRRLLAGGISGSLMGLALWLYYYLLTGNRFIEVPFLALVYLPLVGAAYGLLCAAAHSDCNTTQNGAD